MKIFSVFLDLVDIYLQAGVVRGRFYWALLWNTYAARNPVPTALETQRQTDQYCLWETVQRSRWTNSLAKGRTMLHKANSVLAHIYLSCFATYLLLVFWHTFISHVLAHIYLTFRHIFISYFSTYLSLVFWYIFTSKFGTYLSHVLVHIYLSCFRTYLSHVLAHIYLCFGTYFFVLAHIYLLCFGNIYLMFRHTFIFVLAHIYLLCFGNIYLMFWHTFIFVLAHIYLCFGTYLSLMFWYIFTSHVMAHNYFSRFGTSFYYLSLNVSRNSVLFPEHCK
jgi:hypothetical protein